MGVIESIRKIFKGENSSNAQYLAYSDKESDVLNCMIAYNKYGGYCTPVSSHGKKTTKKILNGEVHAEKTIKFIEEHCGKGDVVHAGAFFGEFIPGISRAISDEAKLWAFEPHPENYRCAFITQQLNNLHNVVLFNAGLGARVTNTKMEVAENLDEFIDEVQIVNKSSTPESEEEVDILPLDSVLPPKRRVSILHLDVEGYEQQVLQGALKTLKRYKPYLILKNVPHKNWMQSNLISNGYNEITKIEGHTIYEFDK